MLKNWVAAVTRARRSDTRDHIEVLLGDGTVHKSRDEAYRSDMSNADVTPEKHRVVGIPWKPGQSGNPAGRPRGSRGKLSEDFLLDLHCAWTAHGADALARCAKTEPGVFCKIVASLLPKSLDVNLSASVDASTFTLKFREALALIHAEPPKIIEHKNGSNQG